jgi:hypothetical protein
VVRVLGSEAAAQIVLKAVAGACRFKGKVPELGSTRAPLAAAFGRACTLGEDTGVRVEIPRELSGRLARELSDRDAVADAAYLAPLGEAALRRSDFELAYAVTAAGLKLTQDRWAEFLFLRARCLADGEDRQGLCVAAASELARRQRNAGLLRRIGEWREGEVDWFDRNKTDVAMSTQQIDDLVERERKLSVYVEPDFMEEDDGGLCDCPSCRAQREMAPPELERMMEEMGPDVVIRALDELMRGMGLPKGRKRRSRPVFDDDAPF